MISRPPGVGVFKFVVVASLRAAQLIRGCPAKIDVGVHKPIVTALLEVSYGIVAPLADVAVAVDPAPAVAVESV